jgi:hypothetical protein
MSTGNQLAFAFVTVQAKKAKNSNAPTMSAKDVDIRECSLADRKMLAKGQLLQICAGDALIIELPRPLFIATSTKVDMLQGTRIELPRGADRQGVISLISYLKDILSWRASNLSMSNNMPIHDMLTITAAAAMLGMEKYVANVYRKCEAKLRNELPSYEDLDTLSYFWQEHAHLLHVVASSNLAVRMREGTIPDTEEFDAYLATNEALNEEIQIANDKHAEWFHRKQENHEAWRQREQARKARAEQAKVRAERDAEKKAFWDNKKSEAAEDELSIQKKLQLSAENRKFTPRERAHWRRTRGIKLPKGC